MLKRHTNRIDVAIVGAGIVGLAHAYALARRGMKVHVFERHSRAWGASIRNFGLFWPIGQEDQWLEIAWNSGQIWKTLSRKAGFWLEQRGALILAYFQEEWDVLEEFFTTQSGKDRDLVMLSNNDIESRYPIVNEQHLKGGLLSRHEFNVNPVEAIPSIAAFLQKELGVVFHFNSEIKFVSTSLVTTDERNWKPDYVIICNGSDFETLYPEVFTAENILRCHLQMMKGNRASKKWPYPVLCSGLSLLHYSSFFGLESIGLLQEKYLDELPAEMAMGIHVLLTENGLGDLIIGDSHIYGSEIQLFRNATIDVNILKYLHRFVKIPDLEIKERWMGTYAVVPGEKTLFMSPDQNVWIATGLGGSGMTLSFGLAEKHIHQMLDQNTINENEQNQRLAY